LRWLGLRWLGLRWLSLGWLDLGRLSLGWLGLRWLSLGWLGSRRPNAGAGAWRRPASLLTGLRAWLASPRLWVLEPANVLRCGRRPVAGRDLSKARGRGLGIA
jgi:hypothetical protein